MNKKLTKIAALSVSLAMAIGVGVALGARSAVKAVKADDSGSVTINSATSNTDGTVTVAISQASGASAPITGSYGVRLYANNTVTITCSSAITSLTIPWTKNPNKAFATVAADVGTYVHPTEAGDGTWSGSATTIVLTVGSTGQVQFASLSYTISSGPALKTLKIQNNSWSAGPFVGDLSDTSQRILLGYDVTDDEILRSGCSWQVSNFNVIDYVLNGETWFFWTPKAAGTVTVTCSCEGFADATTTITVVDATPNPIQAIYSMSASDPIDVFGYYVGFLDGTGPVIMDGDYGVVIYNKFADVSTYTVDETILHVTGVYSAYKGLVEIGSPVIEKACGNLPAEFEPVVYAVVGGETPDKASRKTTVTGVVKSVTIKDIDDPTTYTWDNSKDATIIMTVNENDITVFYKAAAQNADVGAYIMSALESQNEITVKGFTGWFNTFQVAMNGIIEPAPSYTAAEFAQELLDETDAVCATYVPDESQFTAIKAALTTIWSTLAGEGKYPSLPADQKTILAEAARDESGTVVEQAMARYDFLTGKYSLSNFINGRTPVEVPVAYGELNNGNTSNVTVIISIVLASVSAVSIAALLVIKKRKHN